MDKKSRNTIIISILALAIVLITVTYAYFSARITGIESASTISLTAGRMDIVYTEGNEILSFSNIYPREEAWATKTFTLTGYNTTTLDMTYDLNFDIETNTFPDGYLTYDLTLISSTNGTPISTKTNMPINGTETLKIGMGKFTNANGDTHNYELKIYFKDNGEDQNDAQEAVFNAAISVSEYTPKRGTLLSVSSYDINYSNCVSYYSDSPMSSSEIEDYCSGDPIYQNPLSIKRIIKDGYGTDLVDESIIENVVQDGNNNITSYDINYNNCSSAFAGSCSNSELNSLCTGGVIDQNSWSIQKDIDMGHGEDYVDANAIQNVVRDGNDNITSYTINESNCKSLLDDWGYNTDEQNTICSGGVLHDYTYLEDEIKDFGIQTFIDAGVVGNITYDPKTELEAGDTYVDGQYTYVYKRQYYCGRDGCLWESIPNDIDGWGVILTDKSSTVPVTTQLCTTINDKPIVSMQYMFAYSQATSIDLSSFDTSNVFNTKYMFQGSSLGNAQMDLSYLDMSNVQRADYMFSGWNTVNFTNKDLTSLADDSYKMFYGVKNVNLSGSTMNDLHMFATSYSNSLYDYDKDVEVLNLSNTTINTTSTYKLFYPRGWSSGRPSNWTNLSHVIFDNASFPNATSFSEMFNHIQIDEVDFNNVSAPLVTSLEMMFNYASSTRISLNNFTPILPTNATAMFSRSEITTLDLSSFDTSSITNMGSMFSNSQIATLDLSNFDTSQVTSMISMFESSSTTTLDLSSFDTTNVTTTYMQNMFYNTAATVGYARTQADANKFNASSNKPAGLTFVVKP